MIEVKGLVKTFDKFTALNNLNLNVKKASIYGLVGVNGAGKTTIIKHLIGTYRQDHGEIRIDGQDIYENTKLKQRMGVIPDELYFIPNYSMKMTKSFYSNLYNNFNEQRYNHLMQIFKLNDKKPLSKFSKGMQKQASFILNMSIMPDILILDEPLDGLDPAVRRTIIQEILTDVAERELTVLVSSHNLKEMEGICDSIGIMKNGKMIIERDLDDLTSDVNKIQLVFDPNNTGNIENRYEGFKVLHREKSGMVEVIIVSGKKEVIEKQILALNPIVYDIIPLTLEEIFIYEMGETNNENII